MTENCKKSGQQR